VLCERLDLVQDPLEPYGHDANGNELTKAEYDERYVELGPRTGIRESATRWYQLSSSTRGGSEKFILEASSLNAIERYLITIFGPVVRYKREMPRLHLPSSPDELRPGYRISDCDPTSERRTLLDASAQPIAKAREATLSVMDLVLLSVLLAAEFLDIVTSYETDNGSPLFNPMKH
jgi:hypothetical protein